MNIKIELTVPEVHYLRRTLAQGYSGYNGQPEGVRSALMDKITAADAITRGVPIKPDYVEKVRTDGEEASTDRKRTRRTIFPKRVSD